MPHVGLPAKLVDRGGHGKWVAWCRPGLRSRAGMPRRTRKPQRRTRVGSSGEVCAVTDQAPGQRAPTPGGRGQAPTRSQEAGAQGQGPQVLPTSALTVLQRVWAASGGQCGKIPQGVHAAAARPAGGEW